MQDKKPIDHRTWLMAKGLFTLAGSHYAKAAAAMAELEKLLGYEDGYAGYISDEAVDNGDFEWGMKREGFVVKKSR